MTSGSRLTGVIGAVVIFEVLLSFLRHEPQDAQMAVGHGRPLGASAMGIETATASGSDGGASSGLNSRNPTASCRPAIGCGGLPHWGQATRCPPDAGVKRSRHSGQQTWVIADPLSTDSGRSFVAGRSLRPVLSRQATPAGGASPIHHRVIQPRIPHLEVHPVAPAAEHPQDVTALAPVHRTISPICAFRVQGPRGRCHKPQRRARSVIIAAVCWSSSRPCCGGHGRPPLCPSEWDRRPESEKSWAHRAHSEASTSQPARSEL